MKKCSPLSYETPHFSDPPIYLTKRSLLNMFVNSHTFFKDIEGKKGAPQPPFLEAGWLWSAIFGSVDVQKPRDC